jgi:hypothetical protein
MFEEGALRIELHRGNKRQLFEIQASRALVGSGAHCDVRLAPDEAAIEQLTVETLDEDVFARSLSLDRACLINGSAFLEGRVPPDAMLELGGVLIRVQHATRQSDQGQKKSNAAPPARQALMLLGLALASWYVFTHRRVHHDLFGDQVVSPPALVATEEHCPQSAPRVAASLALESLRAAEVKRERAPFYASDGLSAVQLFSRAADCYSRAGDEPAAASAREASEQLRRRLADELHVRHVRLERLISEQNYGELKREGQMIAEYVSDSSSEYSQWLSAVVREGELKTRKEQKKQ